MFQGLVIGGIILLVVLLVVIAATAWALSDLSHEVKWLRRDVETLEIAVTRLERGSTRFLPPEPKPTHQADEMQLAVLDDEPE